MMKLIYLLLAFIALAKYDSSAQIYQTKNGYVHFESDAILELIQANTNKLKGAIDIRKKTFAFTIPISSFNGFNSALQQIHFNENYLESDEYPNAIFIGKIIEKIDITQEGEFIVRAKGKLTIHGVEQERIIKSSVHVEDGILRIESNFSILLSEHDILIPKIISQKIAENIFIGIKAELRL